MGECCRKSTSMSVGGNLTTGSSAQTDAVPHLSLLLLDSHSGKHAGGKTTKEKLSGNEPLFESRTQYSKEPKYSRCCPEKTTDDEM